MIHYDPPLSADLMEQEGIYAADIAAFPFQEPFPDDEIIVGRKSFYFLQKEEEHPHLFGVAIVLLIGKGLLVSIGGARFADENQGIVIPIPFHELLDIAFIPGGGLVGH